MPAVEPTTDSRNTQEAPVFMLEYAITLDDQWRVTVPAAWRQNLPERGQLFIQVRDTHLVVMPLAEVNRFRKWSNEEVAPEDRGDVQRAWARATDQTFIDSAGRITLPAKWAEKVGIAKKTKVNLVGATEKFEIWALKTFEDDPEGSIKRGDALRKKFT